MNDTDEASRPNPQTWASGDYAFWGSWLVIVSERLCEAADPRANHRLLDVATGHGNTALSAARRGCHVTAIDFTRPLLEQARRRAAVDNLPIEFLEGDFEAIPFPDETFDRVLSTFGVIFATDQHHVANELLRVCRTGGKIGLANWTPAGANVAESQAIEKYLPPPSDAPPDLWSTTEGLQELFPKQVTSLQTKLRTITYRFPSMEEYIDAGIHKFGPFKKAVSALSVEELASMKRDVAEVLRPFNQSGDETLVLSFNYLEVVITKLA